MTKGNATVTTPSGKTAVIPAADLTKTAEAASKPNAGDDVITPASKTVVANPEALTPEEKKAIEDKVKAVNPGATVVVVIRVTQQLQHRQVRQRLFQQLI